MKNKIKSDKGSYANLHRQKQEISHNKTSILLDNNEIKKGIKFDDLNDWEKIKYNNPDETTHSNYKKEYQNNNIESKQEVNFNNFYPISQNNNNFNVPIQENNFNSLNKLNYMKENKFIVNQPDFFPDVQNQNYFHDNIEEGAAVLNKINNININPNYEINYNKPEIINNLLPSQIKKQTKPQEIQNLENDLIQNNNKLTYIPNTGNNVNNPYELNDIKNKNKTTKNYPHDYTNYNQNNLLLQQNRDNDDFSINTSNFTNRYDLGNQVDKMDISNLPNNFGYKNNLNQNNNLINLISQDENNFIINTKENLENINLKIKPQTKDNISNNIRKDINKINNTGNLVNYQNQTNNIGTNQNIFNEKLKNSIEPITENDISDEELGSNNKIDQNEELKKKYFSDDLNKNSTNQTKKLGNSQKNLYSNNINNIYDNEHDKKISTDKNLVLKNYIPTNLKNNKNNFNQQDNILDNDDSLDDDGESSIFHNTLDNNEFNVTQKQLKDLKKEFYDIHKITKKSSEIDKNIILKPKNLNNLPNVNLNNPNTTNFTEKTKASGISQKTTDILSMKTKRRPSPYIKNREAINSEKNPVISNNCNNSKSLDGKNIIHPEYLSTKPTSIQTYQQNTNILHIDPILNQYPPMIYNMNTFNNNYGNGYNNLGILNMGYGQIPNDPRNNQVIPNYGYVNPNLINNQVNNGNLPYNSLLPNVNYAYNLQNQGYNNINNINKANTQNYTNLVNPQENGKIFKPKQDLIYKPYTMKEYKDKFNKTTKEEKSGGLGPNIGTKEWEEKAEKKKKIKEYSKNLNIKNKNESISRIELDTENNNANKSYTEKKKIEKKNILVEAKTRTNQVKNFYQNLNKIKESSDKEDSLDAFEDKLERDLFNNDRSEINEGLIPDIKIKSGKGHFHNIIQLKNRVEKTDRNVNENAIILVDMKTKAEKNRPKSGNKIETKKNSKNSNLNEEHNKIYTTLGNDKKINNLKPINSSRINSSLNTTRNSHVKANANGNQPRSLSGNNIKVMKEINNGNGKINKRIVQNNYNEIDDLLQKHDLYYEKAQKIKNFMSKI